MVPSASAGRPVPPDGLVSAGLGGHRVGGHDVDDAATAAAAELHRPGDEREQGVVTAAAYTEPGVEVGAALPDDDLARVDDLAAEPLDAEALRVGVAPVAGGRRALLVSHGICASSCFADCWFGVTSGSRSRCR